MSSTLIWMAVGGLAFSLLGGLAASIIVVKLPKDYFTRPKKSHKGKGFWKDALWVGKNVLGIVLTLGGVVLMMPGIPGPGVVVILLGLTLTDIPGKHKLLLWIVRHPKVMRSMNKLRHRFGRPALVKP